MKLFYGELASLWPLISPVEDYASETVELVRVLQQRAPVAKTLLELGSGGGHVAYYIKRAFRCHLTDLSEAMLDTSKRLNPECAHTVGDMRLLNLGKTFDLVLAHDAIDYMTSEEDLRAVFDTAWRHLAPGGVACFIPDDVADTYVPGTDWSGVDDPSGQAIRLFEWSEPAVAGRSTVVTHYSFLVRDATGEVRAYYEPHTTGLFPRSTWVRLLAERGFAVDVVVERTDEDRPGRLLFIAQKPAGA